MALDIGQILNGRYRIAKKLAEGGFGAVYRAWDLNLNMPCALKENLAVLSTSHEQFSREAQMLAGLHHPNLPRVTDYFTIPDQGQYLAMDFIEGDDLEQMMQRSGGALPVEAVLNWIEQVGEALMYLHSHNPPLIHRDVKPANIKITPSGKAVLVDFGIAKAVAPGSQTLAGARAVTPGYSPPEQYAQGLTDTQSDIYALGATMYALLTGKTPPEATEVLAGVSKSIPPVSALNPAVTIELAAVISKAMRMAKEERFASVGEFLQALGRAKPAAVVGIVSTGVAPVEPPRAPITPQASEPAAALQQEFVAPIAGAQMQQTAYKPAPAGPPPATPPSYPSPSPAGGAPAPKSRLGLILGLSLGAVLLLTLCAVGGWYGYQRYTAGSLEKTSQAIAVILSATPVATATQVASPTPVTPTATDTLAVTLTPTNSPTPELGIGSTKISELDGMTLVYVPEGQFKMGAGSEAKYPLPQEKPQHSVYLDAYWIDKTEVTNAMFEKCVQAGGCSAPNRTIYADRTAYYDNPDRANFPRIYVTWKEAKEYCTWAGRRLPTEAEWEKAARGEDARNYPWGDAEPTCSLANTWGWNYFDSWNDKVRMAKGCGEGPLAVGSTPAGDSVYGVQDMIGNVAEWVADYFDAGYYSVSPERNPTGPASGTNRVVRGSNGYFQITNQQWIRYGGMLFDFADFLFRFSSWARTQASEGYRFYDLGFRCAVSP